MIQDIYPHEFHNEFNPGARPGNKSKVMCFDGMKILAKLSKKTSEDKQKLILPTVEEISTFFAQPTDALGETVRNREGKEHGLQDLVYAFRIDETEYYLDISGQTFEAEGYSYLDVRGQLRASVDNVSGMILFTGNHLYQWYSESRFCGSCGSRAVPDETERAMKCSCCGRKNYPRLMPAVIVGVLNGDKILLTKYKEGFAFYALVAGFAEIGETLEETAAREVMEETGLKVKNIRYYGSQPWGIAKDLLAGFFCDVDGDDTIHMDTGELKLAQWKSREEVELQPDSFSLTNEMMEKFKNGEV